MKKGEKGRNLILVGEEGEGRMDGGGGGGGKIWMEETSEIWGEKMRYGGKEGEQRGGKLMGRGGGRGRRYITS